MKLELSQLDRRYDRLRIRDASRHARLLQSVLRHGQQVPVVVVPDAEPDARFVLIDGYLRVAVLEQLCADEVEAQLWQMSEGRALALAHRLDNARQRSALEEGWLLHTLQREHDMGLGELAVLLGRSRSWVSRRLGLVCALPAAAQEAVRRGTLSAQAAQRYLVPLARANTAQCETLVQQLGSERVSVRDMHTLYVGWRRADAATRERICQSPRLYLAAHDTVGDNPPRDELARDLQIIASVIRRAQRRVDEGALADANAARVCRLKRRFADAERAWRQLGASLEETTDAELGKANRDLGAEQTRPRHPGDRPGGGGITQRGQTGPA